MTKMPWSNWFWRDWDSDPGLRLVSFAAQGLWMRMLCIAAVADLRGYVRVASRPCTDEDIAKIAGGTVEEVSRLVSELEKGGVFSRDAEKGIFCRRMVRETEQLRQSRENGKRGGRPRKLRIEKENKPNPTLSKNQNPNQKLARTRDGDGDGDIDSLSTEKIPETESETGARETPFEKFWRAYPRREDKGHARKAFDRALKKVPLDALLAAAFAYATKRAGQDPKYTALPATWLNGERWGDETPPPHRPPIQPFSSPGFA